MTGTNEIVDILNESNSGRSSVSEDWSQRKQVKEEKQGT